VLGLCTFLSGRSKQALSCDNFSPHAVGTTRLLTSPSSTSFFLSGSRKCAAVVPIGTIGAFITALNHGAVLAVIVRSQAYAPTRRSSGARNRV
jgi:hypothetical protein